MIFRATFIVMMLATACAALAQAPAPATRPTSTVRCAVIGGMQDTGFFPQLAERFTQQTGIAVEVVASGPKDGIDRVFRQRQADLIVMHASDTIIDLVADGFARDARPWARNDMILVGPADDPAGIRGMSDVVKALQQIADKRASFVVHSSGGAQEVLSSLLNLGDIELDPAHTTMLFEDRQRLVLNIAAEKKAYTLIGRIPFLTGKIPNAGMAAMVAGDPRLRRPFMVAVADPSRVPDAHMKEAWRLASFLTDPATQQWIGTFGKGKYDPLPLFYPITTPAEPKPDAILSVRGEVPKALSLTESQFRALPRTEVKVTDRSGKQVTYAGAALDDLLKAAGFTPTGQTMSRGDIAACIIVKSADGYRVSLSLGELREQPAGSQILLTDTRDGQPLQASEGKLKLIVPADARPVRSVRQVVEVDVVFPG